MLYSYVRMVYSTTMHSIRPLDSMQKARLAVSALFLTNGALFASMVPHYPEIKADLALGNGVYGLAVAAFPAGALAFGSAAAFLIRRFGSARIAVAGTVTTAVMVFLVSISPSLPSFALALFFAGSSDAITDVAQNAQGLQVQQRYHRSIINSFHAVWSAGVVIGGVSASISIALHIGRAMHLGLISALLIILALVASRFCIFDDQPSRDTRKQSRPESIRTLTSIPFHVYASLLGMAFIGVVACAVEDSGSSWASLYLSTSLNAPAAVAPLGYISLAAVQFVGRATGDRMVDAFGMRQVTRFGGALIALGLGLALLFPSIPGTIAGFAAAGFGVSTLGPNSMAACDNLPYLRQGSGLTVVSWIMRAGFLLSPPLVGYISDAVNLRTGLLVFPILGVLAVLAANVMPGTIRHDESFATNSDSSL